MRKTTTKDDPKRLRECLAALSEACGHNVFRFEVTTTKAGHKFIITAPTTEGEDGIARLIAKELDALFEGRLRLDTAGLKGDPK